MAEKFITEEQRAGCRKVADKELAIWGHLALQAVPSRQVKYGLT